MVNGGIHDSIYFLSLIIALAALNCIIFRNITDTYSCVTNVQTPAVPKQTSSNITQKPTTIKLLPAVNVQVPAATTQKPITTKLLPDVNVQAPAAIEQMNTATAQALATLASLTCKPSSNPAPSASQPLPSHVSRPVPIHSFGK
ncbi:hypothetical protein DSO57_1001474 [Entomophthora muscae]|uniref:Uncharacterized protein n=1 Tax=Entomophthora muscae TaxID=34485 RepID=A0ACC2UIP0_9FUNG|nr:hypothetical protein DSO57_1001474 [Entomophthora muscae]